MYIIHYTVYACDVYMLNIYVNIICIYVIYNNNILYLYIYIYMCVVLAESVVGSEGFGGCWWIL